MTAPASGLDLVGASDIARRVGVGVDTVWKWRQRYSDFPAPHTVLERGGGQTLRLWEFDVVDEWRRARGLGGDPEEGEVETRHARQAIEGGE